MSRRLLSTSNPRFPAAGLREEEANTRTLLRGGGTHVPAPSAPLLLRNPRCVQFTRMGSDLGVRAAERARTLGEARTGRWGSTEREERRGEPPPWLAGLSSYLQSGPRGSWDGGRQKKDGEEAGSILSKPFVAESKRSLHFRAHGPFWHVGH